MEVCYMVTLAWHYWPSWIFHHHHTSWNIQTNQFLNQFLKKKCGETIIKRTGHRIFHIIDPGFSDSPFVNREVKHHVYIKRQTRISTTWPSFPLLVVYCWLFLHLLVVSCNFSSIVLSCFYLLIFYFEKFSTWIWHLAFAVYMKLKLSNVKYWYHCFFFTRMFVWEEDTVLLFNCCAVMGPM